MDPLRKMHLHTIWISYVMIWLGFWLVFTHQALGYTGAMAWSDIVAGLFLIFLGFFSISYKRSWTPWALALVGVWLQFAPLLFWTQSSASYLNSTLIGAVIIAFSLIMPSTLPDLGSSIPPGWNYNPSSWPQRLPIIILGTIGWFISRYLAAYELKFIDHVWDPIFQNGTLDVLNSTISRSFPVPDAGLGAMAYTLEVLLALKGDEKRWRTMPWMVILFGLLVVPLGLVSITLIILQPLVVGAWCFLCLATAFCMTVMIAFAIDEVIAVLQFLKQQQKLGYPLWNIFWKGGACIGASEETQCIQLDEGLIPLTKAATLGTHLPWNLSLSILLGAFLMQLPWLFGFHTNIDPILGAFIIVTSIIATAKLAYPIRYLNILLGTVLLLSLFSFHQDLTIMALIAHLCIGVCLIIIQNFKSL